MICTCKKTFKFAYFLIFISFLISMRCWIGFEGRNIIYEYMFPVLMLLLSVTGNLRLQHKKRYLIYALLVYIAKMFIAVKAKGTIDINCTVSQAIPSFSIYLILCVVDGEKDRLFHYIVKWFGLLMIPGLILYVISFIITLPSFGIIKAHYGGDFYGEPYYNYLFYIKPIVIDVTGMFRFNGPFIEPGDLGCVSAFVLFAAQYNFKEYKYLWAVLLGLLTSFSLAGYLLAIFGYVVTMFVRERISMKMLVAGTVFLFATYSFGTTYNDGDNYINNSILSRLSDNEMSIGNANGRTSQEKMEFFYAMWNDPNIIWFGYDNQTTKYLQEKALGAGFFNQILAVGLIGIIGLIIPNLYFMLSSSRRKFACMFFVLFILYMYQRCDAFWTSLVICYAFGIIINENKQITI